MSLFQTPAFFGIQDVTVDSVPSPFGLRIYYPTHDDLTVGAPLARGPHPLVVFAHGNRQGPQNETYCPPDLTNDYRRWTRVLGALARSGCVVASPELSDVSYNEGAIDRMEATVQWMRSNWSGRRSLHQLELANPELLARASGIPLTRPEPDDHASPHDLAIANRHAPAAYLGQPTGLVVMGHSWGARAGAVFAANARAQAFVSIAGTFDDSESIAAIRSLTIPNFMLAGTADSQTFSYLNGLWRGLHAPKYQCALRDVDHWDWFGGQGAIRRCDGSTAQWPDTAHVAGELIAGFLTRHVAQLQFAPSHLIRIPLLRPWHQRWLGEGTAIQMRWEAAGQDFGALPSTGSGILGEWPAGTSQDW
jgi:dienelactone hydrolase